MIKRDEYILYGLKECERIIEEIIKKLHIQEICFEIKLILTEALTNAFKHGNKKNAKLPIFLRYIYDRTCVTFEVEDSGEGYCPSCSHNEILDENILDDHGRGLYLIKCFCDEVKMINNILIMKKRLHNPVVEV